MKSLGSREVAEAVLIAALSAVINCAVEWGAGEIAHRCRQAEKKRKRREKANRK